MIDSQDAIILLLPGIKKIRMTG